MNTTEKNTSLISHPVTMGLETSDSFEHMQRVARMLTSSQLVPQQFQGDTGMPNAIIALNMASRMQADPMAVMQNLYIVHGKPAWSSSFLIATVNACGRFTPLRFKMSGKGDTRSCYAYASDRETGDLLEGSEISILMAKAEGWFQKKGSKWQTMPDQMLQYRAATFWVRVYAPEISMGMRPEDEIRDIESEPVVKNVTPAKKPEASRSDTLAEKLSSSPGSSSDSNVSVSPDAGEEENPMTGNQIAMQDFLDQKEIRFETFQAWLLETGRMKDADSCSSMLEVPSDICTALISSPKTLQKLITRAKDLL